MTPNQPTQTMASQLDALDEKITMIMDHLGIQMPDNQEEGPQDAPAKPSMADQITAPGE